MAPQIEKWPVPSQDKVYKHAYILLHNISQTFFTTRMTQFVIDTDTLVHCFIYIFNECDKHENKRKYNTYILQ